MAQRIVVDDLINEIRAMTDEDNRESVDDDNDILPALNRAQNYAVDILARQFKEPLLATASITLVSGVDLYDIPEDALEQRVLSVELNQSGTFYPVQYIDFQDIGIYENSQTISSTPSFYTVVGSQLKIVPKASGTNTLRVWYLRDPMPLVKQQGRINLINAASNYVILDSAGDGLSSTSDDLASFVNLIDGATGIRKGTMQVQSIVDTKITFKTVPTRTLVLDSTVDTSLLTLDTGLTVNQDDYICLAPGSCVPFLKKPLANFLTQYAVAEITRKLGGEAGLEEQVLKKFETQIERTWVQRPNGMRVRKRSANWSMSTGRLPRTGV